MGLAKLQTRESTSRPANRRERKAPRNEVKRSETRYYYNTAWYGNGNLRHSHRDLLKGFEFLLGLARRVSTALRPPHLQTSRGLISNPRTRRCWPMHRHRFAARPNIHSRTHKTSTLLVFTFYVVPLAHIGFALFSPFYSPL